VKWGFDIQVALQEIFNAHVAVGSPAADLRYPRNAPYASDSDRVAA
jgi:hypothetical protein